MHQDCISPHRNVNAVYRERESAPAREIEKDSQTDKETDRQTDRQRGREG